MIWDPHTHTSYLNAVCTAAKVSVASPEFYIYVFVEGDREDEDEGPECFPSMGQGHVQTFPKLMATSSASSSQFHQGRAYLFLPPCGCR